MPSVVADFKKEWRQFKHDEPGERFGNHRERMTHKSKSHMAAYLALGVLLLAGGVVLLFMPGPGLLLIVFGLALVATHSKRLADLMDRGEPKLRAAAHRVAKWWKALPMAGKATVATAGVLIVSAFLFATWKWVVSAYLL